MNTTPLQVSKRGVEVLRHLEGAAQRAYVCPAGLMTIGVGHVLTKDELYSGKIFIDGDEVKWRDGLTDKQVDGLLRQDLYFYQKCVAAYVTVPLSSYQFDALVSFCFNVGMGAFRGSTLLKMLNRGEYAAVPAQLKRWNKCNGKTLNGLTRRREIEAGMWQGINYN